MRILSCLSTGESSAYLTSHTQTGVGNLAFSGPRSRLLPRPQSWVSRSVEKILSLAALRPNWDSYGAAAVAPASIDDAVELIELLGRIDGVAEPVVGATAAGGVAFSWTSPDSSVDVEVDRDGWSYAYVCPADPSLDRDGTAAELSELASLLVK